MRLNHLALRAIRERSGYTQTKAAELAGLDRANYAHMEAGRRPGTPPQIKAIAEALDVPILALTGPTDSEAVA